MSKETYKRYILYKNISKQFEVYVNQTFIKEILRTCVSQKRPAYMSKEIYIYVKRDLHICQKTNMYVKRDLNTSKQFYVYVVQNL